MIEAAEWLVSAMYLAYVGAMALAALLTIIQALVGADTGSVASATTTSTAVQQANA